MHRFSCLSLLVPDAFDGGHQPVAFLYYQAAAFTTYFSSLLVVFSMHLESRLLPRNTFLPYESIPLFFDVWRTSQFEPLLVDWSVIRARKKRYMMRIWLTLNNYTSNYCDHSNSRVNNAIRLLFFSRLETNTLQILVIHSYNLINNAIRWMFCEFDDQNSEHGYTLYRP